MISKHLTSRVSVIAMVAGFAAGCGGSGDAGEEISEADSGLVVLGTATKATSMSSPVRPVTPPLTAVPTRPTVPTQPPLAGTIPADAVGSIGCATVDENVRLPDGTSASLAQDNTWFDGIVPFRFHSSVVPGSATETALLKAMRHYNFMTQVRFVLDANNSQSDHVLFRTDLDDCKSQGIGFEGGTQVVNLHSPPSGVTCASFDVAVHELGHRVGLHHEQRRVDRDLYILIQDGKLHDGMETNDNIQESRLRQFDIYRGPGYQVGGFDFDSVMLYPSMVSDPTFAKDINKPIITKRDGSIYPNPQTGGLSAGDTATLFQLYPPPALVANMDNTCRTAPLKRSSWPSTNTALFPRPAELLAVSNNGGTTAFSEHPSTLSSFGSPSSWGTSGSFQNHAPWAAGDFNKDGLTDIAEIQNSDGLNRIVVRSGYGSGLNYQKIWADRAGKFEHARQWLPGDFDMDGDDDLAVVWRDGARTTLSVFRSNGGAFGDAEHWAIQDSAWDWYARWTVGDFNNDGRADIAATRNDGGSNTISVWISNGSSFNQQSWAIQQGTFDYFSKWLAGDFSGDGLTDLVEIRMNGTATVTRVFVSTGGSFSAPVEWLSFVNGTVAPPPVIGTLATDLPTGTFATATPATATPATGSLATGTLATGTLATARQISTGPGTIPPVVVVDPDPPAFDVSRWAAGDFNDDGRTDLASIWDNGGTTVITVLRSTGSSFTHANWSTAAGAFSATSQWCAGRFRDPIGGGVIAQ